MNVRASCCSNHLFIFFVFQTRWWGASKSSISGWSGKNKSITAQAWKVTVNLCYIIIWLAPWAGKVNQIFHCDWLPKRTRWSYLACSGLHCTCTHHVPRESQIINPLLTKLVWSRWLDIGLVRFLRVYGPRRRWGPWTRKKSLTWPIFSHLDPTLGQ